MDEKKIWASCPLLPESGDNVVCECLEEIERLRTALAEAGRRACALEHPKGENDKRDDIELFLRDAYAAGCNAARSGSMYTAMEYAGREAPRLRALLKPNRAISGILPASPRRNAEEGEWMLIYIVCLVAVVVGFCLGVFAVVRLNKYGINLPW